MVNGSFRDSEFSAEKKWWMEAVNDQERPKGSLPKGHGLFSRKNSSAIFITSGKNVWN